MTEELELQGTSAVFYCDAGYEETAKEMYNYKHNFAGIAIHGYVYLDEPPKKGTGNPKVIPGPTGYYRKENVTEESEIVTPVLYIDIAKGVPPREAYNSSNQAELRALMTTLKWILEKGKDLTKVYIYSDSKYAVIGSNEWLEKWARNSWRTASGSEIKNKRMWMETEDLLDKVRKQCVDGFVLDWVRGHNGDTGNEAADVMATKAKAMAAKDSDEQIEYLSIPQGYWKVGNESPRILQAPRWYFSTTDHDYVDANGRYVYYIGAHGTKEKELDLVGKRVADNFLGIVKIEDPDPVMEELRKQYLAKSTGEVCHLMVNHLDVIFSPKQYRELRERGHLFTIDRKHQVVKTNDTGAIISNAMEPMGLGFRMVDIWTILKNNLEEYHRGDPGYTTYNLIDHFFDKHPKKDEYKIKPTITQMTKFIDIKPEFNLAGLSDPEDIKTRKTRLLLGSDILTRNQLAAVAAEVHRLELITWRESSSVGRYATYVELKNGDHGLWCRYDANFALFES